ncbi:hypothetical protein [Acinetobacter sp. MB5]|uniref:hypothetical protein n=1 Tax=Acinetobacter sp. MB5 TaxID=2069438 RepID=UPI000DCFF9DC|nr:hypothetical protein [Acinetobacter sp. MB5]
MSEKLNESVTFKLRDIEKQVLVLIANEQNLSLSELVRAVVIRLIHSKGSFYFAQVQTSLTRSISDTLDTARKQNSAELISQIELLFTDLKAQVNNKPEYEPIPEFELAPQLHRIIDVTPKTKLIGTKKAQLLRPTELLLPFSN